MDKNKNEYWAEQIRLQKLSGLSQQKWCEENLQANVCLMFIYIKNGFKSLKISASKLF
jgi:hypothetical protein